jgi:hypothetical protein
MTFSARDNVKEKMRENAKKGKVRNFREIREEENACFG